MDKKKIIILLKYATSRRMVYCLLFHWPLCTVAYRDGRLMCCKLSSIENLILKKIDFDFESSKFGCLELFTS